MGKIINWLKARIVEPSTKAGLASLLALAGIHWTEPQFQAVWLALAAVVQLWQVFRSEPK